MKKTKKIVVLTFLFSFILQSCSRENKLENTALDTSTPSLTKLDKWLRKEFTTPYNIEVEYLWNHTQADPNRYLFPPTLDKVKPAMEIIKKVWIDPYNEVGGNDFVRKIAPRKFFLVGGVNLNPSGTVLLGFAEGGKKISLFELNTLDPTSERSIKTFVGTVQHEYCHILNQTKPFDQQKWRLITPDHYTAQWSNSNNTESKKLGYISAYARASPVEDIAEMMRTILSNDNTAYNQIIDNIRVYLPASSSSANPSTPPVLDVLGTAKARKAIRDKEAILVKYMKNSYDIDLYKLQAIVARNTEEIIQQN